MKDWYKELVVYQIWPRSFCDGNGDGIGDLEGVLSKLDYLEDLGINCIWFSPLYPSPNADYGYDIADYRNIHEDYGNLELFKKVLDEAHKRGIKVIMDLVVNHTSDEHQWFIDSQDKDSPYHDYYIWRKGRGKRPPNNWLSCFEGGAWEYNNKLNEYYLHVFAKKQPDLNHDNPKVRQEVKDIMKFWLDMGVDGFREDVITFISKRKGLPNGFPIPAACGIEHYMDGPNIHQYLQEYREVTNQYDCFTVGEAPMMTPGNALKYISEGKKELDLMFHFQHIEADCFMVDYIQTRFDLRKMKHAFSNWQYKLNGKAWNTLYIENHDHPRIISRYGSEKYRVESGKMLANMYMLQQGTPFIYQGQEIGMLNTALDSLDDYEDCFVKNNYNVARNKVHIREEKCWEWAVKSTRDNSRTPVQWDDSTNAGFTTGTPWFPVNKNYPEINAKKEMEDPNSILNHYKKLIKFKKENEVAIYGDYKEHYKNSGKLYVYERNYNGKRLLVINSFTEDNVAFEAPAGFELEKGTPILCNYDNPTVQGNGFKTRPYETRVYVFES
ncbi:MAG: alpha-glucosidase [Eubacterium sp.]|nr:alpha-glucosidase [Eubacterium sp.]MDE6767156.1 alpha-glucosidase [Eubacterium sp.]